MTTVINLIGGPGIGKSTLAAELYAKMKRKHMNVEMVREVAKEWALEGRQIGPFEQLSILGEQIKRESSLFNKVDYIVTDSPVLLGAFYLEYNHNQDFMNKPILDYYYFAQTNGVKFINYKLPRINPYDTKGRFESEKEATDIDDAIYFYLACLDYDFNGLEYLKTNEEIIEAIMSDLA
jgi:deoxyadenosine/deoxycytidine kinase